MNHNLKAAIIGCGAISSIHIDAIQKNSLGTICAICDTNGERLLQASLRIPGVATYSDYREMLDSKRADVVHICTPHYLHREMAIYAMETGHDVYLEKPIALCIDDANEIIRVAEKTGRKICVSFQNRIVPTTLGVKSVIEDGSLGKLIGMKGIVTWKRCGDYYTKSGWRGTWDKEGGGTLMNQAIHTLDLLCMFGGDVDKVEGTASLRTNRGDIEVEDTAEATITFKNGVTALFYATNCYATSSPVEIEYVFEKGEVLVRDEMLYRSQGGKIESIAENGKPGIGKNVWGVGHADMIDNFYGAVDGTKKAYYCTLQEGVKVLSVIEQIYRNNGKSGIKNPIFDN